MVNHITSSTGFNEHNYSTYRNSFPNREKEETHFCTANSSYSRKSLSQNSNLDRVVRTEIEPQSMINSQFLTRELLSQFERYCHQIEQHYLFKKQHLMMTMEQTNPSFQTSEHVKNISKTSKHSSLSTAKSISPTKYGEQHHSTITTHTNSTIHRQNISIVVGMSGGVDSSLTACLLKEFGFNVMALHMRNWDSAEEDPSKQFCTFTKDWNDVKTMCDKYQIPLVGDGMHPVEFIDEYWNDVFERLLDGYIQGQTPNPDLFCNKFIKFDAMLKYAQEKCGADYIGTGHYAQIGYEHASGCNATTTMTPHTTMTNKTTPPPHTTTTPPHTIIPNIPATHLLRAIDHSKDQSYFLAFVNKHAFHSSLFPLGGFLKTDHVRLLARDYFKFPNELWNRKDSVGICFIGKRKFKDFLSKYINITPGNIISIVDKQTILGKHDGISFYTIGQGIGLSGMKDKWFVCEKDTRNNILYACPGNDHYSLMKSEFSISNCHWLEDVTSESNEDNNKDYYVKVRYNQKEPFACSIEKIENDKYKIVLKEEQARAIAPGQVAVLYKRMNEFPEMVCVGGGIY
ncbi:hypothetical protein C9374_006950 [Naegleria lovaniensis]|uniref:tRNA-5-taurinomethyluridine 2-sulfurtransferase n=1 Tax=Naegleria lovaniensis TaxID=51637 RepID=A0AA88GZF4_NAELO|nr:uncharacterized protein C9374_006950 [Naegleria lovaniensis]KAG2393419.1 hypothetical protein C9374_006950 [Naegleria lovaniensis]